MVSDWGRAQKGQVVVSGNVCVIVAVYEVIKQRNELKATQAGEPQIHRRVTVWWQCHFFERYRVNFGSSDKEAQERDYGEMDLQGSVLCTLNCPCEQGELANWPAQNYPLLSTWLYPSHS